MQIINILLKNINKFSKRFWPLGSFLFVSFYIYNIYGSSILHLHKKTKPTQIDPTAHIHPSACISPWGVYVKKNVSVADRTVIRFTTSIGSQTHIENSCVIGNTGFQVIRFRDHRLSVVHTGKVIIGEGVQIGERTSIDRGLFGGTTSVGDFTRIGSHTVIGHNIKIGSHCIIGDSVAIGGKSIIGDRVTIGNNVSIANRIKIESGSTIIADSIITRDVKKS